MTSKTHDHVEASRPRRTTYAPAEEASFMDLSSKVKIAAGALLLAVAAVSTAPPTPADPIIPQAGSEPADATIRDLQNAGFEVRINYGSGSVNEPLSECKVTNINNPNGAMASMITLSTVYVSISCDNAK